MRELIEELEDIPLDEMAFDNQKQGIVLMGLPAAGKSTFIRSGALAKIVPRAKSFSVTNSDSQVKALQYKRAQADYNLLKNTPESKFDSTVDGMRYRANSGSDIKLDLTYDEFQAYKGVKSFYNAKNKDFYGSYFDIRDLAKERNEKLLQDKVSKGSGVVVLDTVASKPAKIKRWVDKLKARGFGITLVYLDINPELSVVRDDYRGKTEGRSVGRGVIMGYAKMMDSAFNVYKKETIKPDGFIDRVFKYRWEPKGDSPIKGTWKLVYNNRGDIARGKKRARAKMAARRS
jgi:hypothetical protein